MSKIKAENWKTKAKAESRRQKREEPKSLAKTKGGPTKLSGTKGTREKQTFESGLLIWQIPRNQEQGGEGTPSPTPILRLVTVKS